MISSPRSSRLNRSLFACLLGLLLCVPFMAQATGGTDESGEGSAAPPSTAQAERIQQEARDEAARQQAEEAQRQEAARLRAASTASSTAAGTVTATSLTPVTPELSVPIPGLTFRPAYNEGSYVVIPYLADYISAVYKYLLGISTLIAIIVVIYGGFLYLLGQTVGSAQTGMTLIKDAIAGLIILYTSYLILYLINPNLVNLKAIRLLRINSVAVGEGSGVEITPGSGGSADGGGGQCLRYMMGNGSYATTMYGPSPELFSAFSSDHIVARDSHGSNQGHTRRAITSYSNLQQSGCGPYSVASVLAYYGLKVAVPNRVPTVAEGGGPTSMHLIDPADTAILAVLNDYRVPGVGTDGGLTSPREIERTFPQFTSRNISTSDTEGILNALRARRPLVFTCSHVELCDNTTCATPMVSSHTPGQTELYPNGHFMVLSGLITDEILSVHDVGSSRTVAMRLQELQHGTYTKANGQVKQACGGIYEITPKSSYTPTATATWGTGSEAIQVQMELPATAGSTGGQCRSSSHRSSRAPAGALVGTVQSRNFSYLPPGVTEPSAAPLAWTSHYPTDSARLLYPSRLEGTQNARVHVLVYLHGNNTRNEQPEAKYITHLRPPLEAVAGGKNVVIMTVHHTQAANAYPNFDLEAFYRQGIAKLNTFLPGVTVIDTVVGGHSGATCSGGPVLRQAITNPTPDLRGILAYDGCLGDVIKESNFRPTGNTALYLAPDIKDPEMGNASISSGTGGQTPRYQAVRSQWGLSAQTCPPCATGVGNVQCYGKNASFTNPGHGGELISFETHAGHAGNVDTLTSIALCAFAQNVATATPAPATPASNPTTPTPAPTTP